MAVVEFIGICQVEEVEIFVYFNSGGLQLLKGGMTLFNGDFLKTRKIKLSNLNSFNSLMAPMYCQFSNLEQLDVLS